MKGLKVAKVVYYILVFCWLMQISMQGGFSKELTVPTLVLIVYGAWLNYKMRNNNNNNK